MLISNDVYAQHWEEARTSAEREGLQINEIGWEQHVIIDLAQNIVYRYPRHAAAAAKLIDEVAVLDAVNKHDWPILLPVMLEHNEIFTKYIYIPGQILDMQTLEQLNSENMHDIGVAIGEFLARFHRLDPGIVQRKHTKQSTSLLEYYGKRIEGAKDTEHYTKASAALQQITQALGSYPPAVVHGDLHGQNIVINPETKQLVGVIDLSEMETGDPHQEFRKLFMTDARLVEPAITGYIAGGGPQLDVSRITAWAFVNEWANVCHFARQPKNATYQRAIAHLQHWQQI